MGIKFYKSKRSDMEEKEEEEGTESEQISEDFICAVCLDVLYKPIVLACGHVSCFWCCQNSMSWKDESRCPLCRQQYHHFPAICQMLHFLLKKIYPVSYHRRKAQTLEDEKRRLHGLGFSPDIDNLVTTDESNHLSFVGQSSELNCGDNSSGGRSSGVEKKLNKGTTAETCNRVSVADVLCVACKQLLFQPVVLNCGHVYCEACITIPADGMLKCQVCQCRHPSGFPKVCKVFDHFLKEQFSSEYAQRVNSTQLNGERIRNGDPSKGDNTRCTKFPFPRNNEDFHQWWTVHGSKFHPFVGCDVCGMYPIVGDRYKCKDCPEKGGYDLCGDCYRAGAALPGRFNQRHTPEHKLELEDCTMSEDIMFGLIGGFLEFVSAAAQRNLSDHANGNAEYESPSFDDIDEDTVVRGSIESPDDTRGDQNDNQAPM